MKLFYLPEDAPGCCVVLLVVPCPLPGSAPPLALLPLSSRKRYLEVGDIGSVPGRMAAVPLTGSCPGRTGLLRRNLRRGGHAATWRFLGRISQVVPPGLFLSARFLGAPSADSWPVAGGEGVSLKPDHHSPWQRLEAGTSLLPSVVSEETLDLLPGWAGGHYPPGKENLRMCISNQGFASCCPVRGA